MSAWCSPIWRCCARRFFCGTKNRDTLYEVKSCGVQWLQSSINSSPLPPLRNFRKCRERFSFGQGLEHHRTQIYLSNGGNKDLLRRDKSQTMTLIASLVTASQSKVKWSHKFFFPDESFSPNEGCVCVGGHLHQITHLIRLDNINQTLLRNSHSLLHLTISCSRYYNNHGEAEYWFKWWFHHFWAT